MELRVLIPDTFKSTTASTHTAKVNLIKATCPGRVIAFQPQKTHPASSIPKSCHCNNSLSHLIYFSVALWNNTTGRPLSCFGPSVASSVYDFKFRCIVEARPGLWEKFSPLVWFWFRKTSSSSSRWQTAKIFKSCPKCRLGRCSLHRKRLSLSRCFPHWKCASFSEQWWKVGGHSDWSGSCVALYEVWVIEWQLLSLSESQIE